jgi:hypothetical protein
VDEASKEMEDKAVLIKAINPSILATILDKKVKCRLFSDLQIPIPVVWIDHVFNRDDDEDYSNDSDDSEVVSGYGGLVL